MMINAQRLFILTELRTAKGITLEQMAQDCGLTGKRSRISVGRWEAGKSTPRVRHRPKFIEYLCVTLGLRENKELFVDIWSIIMEEWGWDDLNAEEIEIYFSESHTRPIIDIEPIVFFPSPGSSSFDLWDPMDSTGTVVAKEDFHEGIKNLYAGNYDLASRYFNAAWQNDSTFINAYLNCGIAYLGLKQFDRAIAYFDKTIELDPNYAILHACFGFAYTKLKDYNQAIIYFDKAIELDPKYADAYNNRGFAHYKMGNYQLAIADFSKIINLNPGYKTQYAYHNRGLAHQKTGDIHNCIKDFNTILQMSRDPYKQHQLKKLIKSLEQITA